MLSSSSALFRTGLGRGKFVARNHAAKSAAAPLTGGAEPTLIAHDHFAIRGGGERLVLTLAEAIEADVMFGYKTTNSYDSAAFPENCLDLDLPIGPQALPSGKPIEFVDFHEALAQSPWHGSTSARALLAAAEPAEGKLLRDIAPLVAQATTHVQLAQVPEMPLPGTPAPAPIVQSDMAPAFGAPISLHAAAAPQVELP
ncbi:MAG TPA: hypothetical protein VGB81_10515, partial [Devosia sp.]